MVIVFDSGVENTSITDSMTSYNVSNESGISQVALDVYNAYLFFVMVLGLPGNTLVLVVFAKHKPNTTTDWFILFITICDFVTLFINVPVYLTLTNGIWNLYGNNAICLLHMFVSQSVVLSSSFLICGLALDRYFRVCRPMMSYSTLRARNICIFISILTTALSLPCFILYESRQGSCSSSHVIGFFIYYLMLFLTFVAAAVIVVVSYIKVYARIKETENTISKHNDARMMTRNIELNRNLATGKINQVFPICENPNKRGHCGKQSIRFKDAKESVNGNGLVEPNFVSDTGCQVTEVSTVSGKGAVSTAAPACLSSSLALPARKSYRQASMLTTKISFLVCAVFIISWIPPWATFIILGRVENFTGLAEVLMFAKQTYLLNTTSNPILYAWFNRKFRKHMLEILGCDRF